MNQALASMYLITMLSHLSKPLAINHRWISKYFLRDNYVLGPTLVNRTDKNFYSNEAYTLAGGKR